MGCVSAKISRCGGVGVKYANLFNMGVTTRRIDGIGAELTNVCGIGANIERVSGIKVRLGLICSANYAKKLEVSKEHLWLLPDNFFQDSFAIITEVEWHIL